MSKRKRNSITAEQWFWFDREALESPAFRQLSLSALRVYFRIALEYMHHAGKDNGRLPVTYDQFVEYGIHRHAIAPAIRELEALGFVEVTQRGKASAGGNSFPNYFRLTDRPTKGDPRTCEWKRIKTDEQAQMLAREARNPPKDLPKKIISPVSKTITGPVTETRHWKRHFPSDGNHHYCPSDGNHHYLYISGACAQATEGRRRGARSAGR
jgi:hypothetical protein